MAGPSMKEILAKWKIDTSDWKRAIADIRSQVRGLQQEGKAQQTETQQALNQQVTQIKESLQQLKLQLGVRQQASQQLQDQIAHEKLLQEQVKTRQQQETLVTKEIQKQSAELRLQRQQAGPTGGGSGNIVRSLIQGIGSLAGGGLTGAVFGGAFLGGGLAEAIPKVVEELEKVIEKVKELVKESDKLNNIQQLFERLALRLGETPGLLLSQLQEATHGLVTNTQLMTQANQLLLQNLPLTGKQLVDLTSRVTDFSIRTGKDATESMQILTRALETGRLGYLSYSLNLEKGIRDQLTFANQLPESVRLLYEYRVVMDELARQTDVAGKAQLGFATQLQQMDVMVDNFFHTVSEQIGRSSSKSGFSLSGVLDQLFGTESAGGGLDVSFGKAETAADKLRGWAEGIGETITGIFEVAGTTLKQFAEIIRVELADVSAFFGAWAAGWEMELKPVVAFFESLFGSSVTSKIDDLKSRFSSLRSALATLGEGFVITTSLILAQVLATAELVRVTLGAAKSLFTFSLTPVTDALAQAKKDFIDFGGTVKDSLVGLEKLRRGESVTPEAAPKVDPLDDLKNQQKLAKQLMEIAKLRFQTEVETAKEALDTEKQLYDDMYKAGLIGLEDYVKRQKELRAEQTQVQIAALEEEKRSQIQNYNDQHKALSRDLKETQAELKQAQDQTGGHKLAEVPGLQEQVKQIKDAEHDNGVERTKIEMSTNLQISKLREQLARELMALDKQPLEDLLKAQQTTIQTLQSMQRASTDTQKAALEKQFQDGKVSAQSYLEQRVLLIQQEKQVAIDAAQAEYLAGAKNQEAVAKLLQKKVVATDVAEKQITQLQETQDDIRIKAEEATFDRVGKFYDSQLKMAQSSKGNDGGFFPNKDEQQILNVMIELTERRIQMEQAELETVDQMSTKWLEVQDSIAGNQEKLQKYNEELAKSQDWTSGISKLFGQMAGVTEGLSKNIAGALRQAGSSMKAFGESMTAIRLRAMERQEPQVQIKTPQQMMALLDRATSESGQKLTGLAATAKQLQEEQAGYAEELQSASKTLKTAVDEANVALQTQLKTAAVEAANALIPFTSALSQATGVLQTLLTKEGVETPAAAKKKVGPQQTFQTGGPVTQTGLAHVDAGEFVFSPSMLAGVKKVIVMLQESLEGLVRTVQQLGRKMQDSLETGQRVVHSTLQTAGEAATGVMQAPKKILTEQVRTLSRPLITATAESKEEPAQHQTLWQKLWHPKPPKPKLKSPEEFEEIYQAQQTQRTMGLAPPRGWQPGIRAPRLENIEGRTLEQSLQAPVKQQTEAPELEKTLALATKALDPFAEALSEVTRAMLKMLTGGSGEITAEQQKKLPHFQSGGPVGETGPAVVHAGEFVLSTEMVGNVNKAMQSLASGIEHLTKAIAAAIQNLVTAVPKKIQQVGKNIVRGPEDLMTVASRMWQGRPPTRPAAPKPPPNWDKKSATQTVTNSAATATKGLAGAMEGSTRVLSPFSTAITAATERMNKLGVPEPEERKGPQQDPEAPEIGRGSGSALAADMGLPAVAGFLGSGTQSVSDQLNQIQLMQSGGTAGWGAQAIADTTADPADKMQSPLGSLIGGFTGLADTSKSASERLGGFADSMSAVTGIVGGVEQTLSGQGGMVSSAITGASTGAQIGSLIPLPFAGVIGAGVGAIVGLFTGAKADAAQKITKKIEDSMKTIEENMQAGNVSLMASLNATIALREQAINELSGSKAGRADLKSLLPTLDQQIEQLQMQMVQAQQQFEKNLQILQAPEPYQSSLNSIESIISAYSQYVQAGGLVANANAYLQDSFQQLAQQGLQQLNQDQQDAINNALSLQDLLQQQADLTLQTNMQIASVMQQGNLVREPTIAASKAAEIEQIQQQAAVKHQQLTEEIQVAQYKLDVESKIFQLATTRTGLEAQLVALQDEQTNVSAQQMSALANVVKLLQTVTPTSLISAGTAQQGLPPAVAETMNNILAALGLPTLTSLTSFTPGQPEGHGTTGVLQPGQVGRITAPPPTPPTYGGPAPFPVGPGVPVTTPPYSGPVGATSGGVPGVTTPGGAVTYPQMAVQATQVIVTTGGAVSLQAGTVQGMAGMQQTAQPSSTLLPVRQGVSINVETAQQSLPPSDTSSPVYYMQSTDQQTITPVYNTPTSVVNSNETVTSSINTSTVRALTGSAQPSPESGATVVTAGIPIQQTLQSPTQTAAGGWVTPQPEVGGGGRMPVQEPPGEPGPRPPGLPGGPPAPPPPPAGPPPTQPGKLTTAQQNVADMETLSQESIQEAQEMTAEMNPQELALVEASEPGLFETYAPPGGVHIPGTPPLTPPPTGPRGGGAPPPTPTPPAGPPPITTGPGKPVGGPIIIGTGTPTPFAGGATAGTPTSDDMMAAAALGTPSAAMSYFLSMGYPADQAQEYATQALQSAGTPAKPSRGFGGGPQPVVPPVGGPIIIGTGSTGGGLSFGGGDDGGNNTNRGSRGKGPAIKYNVPEAPNLFFAPGIILPEVAANTFPTLGSQMGAPGPGPIITVQGPGTPYAGYAETGLGTPVESYQGGGVATADTRALLHAGEVVVPPEGTGFVAGLIAGMRQLVNKITTIALPGLDKGIKTVEPTSPSETRGVAQLGVTDRPMTPLSVVGQGTIQKSEIEKQIAVMTQRLTAEQTLHDLATSRFEMESTVVAARMKEINADMQRVAAWQDLIRTGRAGNAGSGTLNDAWHATYQEYGRYGVGGFYGELG